MDRSLRRPTLLPLHVPWPLARVLALSLVAAGGCGRDSTPPPTPTSIVASASNLTFDAVGATQSFTVTVRDQNGTPMTGVTPAATSSAPTVASVTGGATATVTAVANGSTTITVTAGSATTSVAVTVAQVPTAPLKVAGDAQSGSVGAVLPGVMRVKLQDRLGNPVASRDVTFTPSAGGGTANPATVATASDGTASTSWTLGTAPGAMSLSATTTGVAGAATFTATASVGPAATLNVYAGNNQVARVGLAVPTAPAVRVADRYDNPVANTEVMFTAGVGSGTIAGSPATTNAQGVATAGGWTLGTTPGTKSMAATVPGLGFAAFNATATTGPAATLAVSAGNNQLAGPGAAVALAPAVLVTDLYANPVAGAVVTFTVASGGGSATGTPATSNSQGIATLGRWTLGSAVGTNTLAATASGLSAVTFTATAIVAPMIASVSPSPLVPGGTVTVTGSGFAPTLSGNALRVGGATATVTSANATQLIATVPCVVSGSVAVTVTTGGLTSPTATATFAGNVRTLAVGQAFVAPTNAASLCNELPATGGGARYLVSVYSASTSLNSQIDFELGGNPSAAAVIARQYAPLRARRSLMAADGDDARRDRAHWNHLERERALVEELRARTRALGGAGVRTKAVTAAATAPVVGERRVFNWSWTSCADTATHITARVLYAGSRAIIWEDTSNALLASANASLADRYQRIGTVFDTDQYDVVKNTFGDPLRRDPLTDNDGRVHMIFTHRVNDIGGVAAFVTSADQYPRPTCATSNVGEFFYGGVPTQAGSGLESSAYPDGWYNFMNRTIVHEVKHIASMAARVANGAPFEASWLEEGTARHAEEVWARQALHHAAWRGNHGFGTAASNGLYCDFHSSDATCLANDPLRRPSFGVRRQFNEIRPKLLEPWNWSPFGDAAGQSGSVFYQTAWSLVRYAIDNYGASDAAFLTALTNSTSTGTTNLANVTGIPFDQLIGGWSLALFADDYPGLAGASGVLQFQTWNLRDIYSALYADPLWNVRFTTPYPIVPTALPLGAFLAQQSGMRGGASTYFELSGTLSAAQVLNLRAVGGGPSSSLLRIAIARLQ